MNRRDGTLTSKRSSTVDVQRLLRMRQPIAAIALSAIWLATAACPASAQQGSIITIANAGVRNPGPNTAVSVRLSDVIVYPVNRALGPIPLRLRMDPSDDVTLMVGQRVTHEITFLQPSEIERVAVSQLAMIGGQSREIESVYLTRTITEPLPPGVQPIPPARRMAMLADPAGDPLFLAISEDDYTDPPDEGTPLMVMGGMVTGHPDWLVGSTFDFDTGEILSPFSGSAVVQSIELALRITPEPSTCLLILTGLGVLCPLRRRRLGGDAQSPIADYRIPASSCSRWTAPEKRVEHNYGQ